MKDSNFDYIVIGAGSAGCAAAYRLAKNSSASVLLMEAGSPAKNIMLHIPLGFAFLLKAHKNNWGYKTQPEPFLNNRRVDLPRGKVLGGCSAINGMVYVRGQKEDFDHWADVENNGLGNKGWSYEEVLPLFKRSEDNEAGANNYHGVGGALWVGELIKSKVPSEFPICEDFIKACEQAGIPRNRDINGATQEGAGYFPHNIFKGKRLSSASAFLERAAKLDNLTVLSYAEATKIIFKNKKAVAVECAVKNSVTTIHCTKEIIICGGAINSPKLLEHSGIGCQKRLSKLNIPLVQHLPGVGENLHDHWNAYIKHGVDKGETYFTQSKPLAMIRNLFRYIFKREGFLSNPAALVAVFYKAVDNALTPDAQIHFAPAASNVDAKGNMIPIEGITVATCGMRPTSRGSTHVVSTYTNDAPAVQLNYLQTEYDQKVAVAAFKKARNLFRQSALQQYGGAALDPNDLIQSDEEILEYIRNTGDPVHHLAGSCKMGSDELSVVDNQLRVRGTEGLRIADASIMPKVVSGNTHAACVMIGEKVANLCLEK